jgi:hypothetical protein
MVSAVCCIPCRNPGLIVVFCLFFLVDISCDVNVKFVYTEIHGRNPSAAKNCENQGLISIKLVYYF